MDEITLVFLRRLRRQVRAAEPLEGDRRNVYTGDVAQQLGMDETDYERCLGDLVRAGYLVPHPNPSFERQGVYRITDAGIAKADEK
jgi:DNA-binding MarR family transcriptional regulator